MANVDRFLAPGIPALPLGGVFHHSTFDLGLAWELRRVGGGNEGLGPFKLKLTGSGFFLTAELAFGFRKNDWILDCDGVLLAGLGLPFMTRWLKNNNNYVCVVKGKKKDLNKASPN